MIEIIAFYIAATFLVVSSVAVIISNNPVRSAMFLILAFFSAASLWILLQAEFLAILLVLVYVGAVMVLFIYVIMIVNVQSSPVHQKLKAQSSLIWLIGTAIFTQLTLVLAGRYFNSEQAPEIVRQDSYYSNTKELGLMLFQDYLYPFELAGILLLLAIVSAIVLIAKEKRTGKHQDPSAQSKVSKAERLKIIHFDKEPLSEKIEDKKNDEQLESKSSNKLESKK